MSSADLEWVDSLKQLKASVGFTDYEEIVRKCETLLANVPDEAALIVGDIYEVYIKSLLNLGNSSKALEVARQVPEEFKDQVRVLHMYALYRLDRYQEVIDHTTSSDDRIPDASMKHIHAQALYHSSESIDAYSRYLQMIEDSSFVDDEEYSEILTNLGAVLGANAVPYVKNNKYGEEFTERAQDHLEKISEVDDDYPYDLAFNVGTWELTTESTAQHRARAILQKAEKACQARLQEEGMGEKDVLKETAPIAANIQWSRVFWMGEPLGLTAEKSKDEVSLPESVRKVKNVNQALVAQNAKEGLKHYPEEIDGKWTTLQKRIYQFNKAVMQLRAGCFVDCRASCDSILATLTIPPSKTKKKQQNGEHYKAESAMTYDSNWWEARAGVLLSLCLKEEGKLEQARNHLRGIISSLEQKPQSPVLDNALCFAKLHLRLLEEEATGSRGIEAIEIRELLPASLRTKRAVIATVAAAYQKQNKGDELAELLKSTYDDLAMADFEMTNGNFYGAAQLYEKAKESGDPIATAKYVQALSHVDPSQATRLWKEARISIVDDDSFEATGADLELLEIPRLKTANAKSSGMETLEDDTENMKKSHDSVLRRRARHREEYLQQLEKKGLYRSDRPTKPDPERWLPKYERSYAKRRRNRGGLHKGAQGGVSEKDAAKLDVVARQAAISSGEASTSGRSTAHMAVSSAGGPRKGGKRR